MTVQPYFLQVWPVVSKENLCYAVLFASTVYFPGKFSRGEPTQNFVGVGRLWLEEPQEDVVA